MLLVFCKPAKDGTRVASLDGPEGGRWSGSELVVWSDLVVWSSTADLVVVWSYACRLVAAPGGSSQADKWSSGGVATCRPVVVWWHTSDLKAVGSRLETQKRTRRVVPKSTGAVYLCQTDLRQEIEKPGLVAYQQQAS